MIQHIQIRYDVDMMYMLYMMKNKIGGNMPNKTETIRNIFKKLDRPNRKFGYPKLLFDTRMYAEHKLKTRVTINEVRKAIGEIK